MWSSNSRSVVHKIQPIQVMGPCYCLPCYWSAPTFLSCRPPFHPVVLAPLLHLLQPWPQLLPSNNSPPVSRASLELSSNWAMFVVRFCEAMQVNPWLGYFDRTTACPVVEDSCSIEHEGIGLTRRRRMPRMAPRPTMCKSLRLSLLRRRTLSRPRTR